MFFPVSTLLLTAQTVREVIHFKYDYHDNFTVISIHTSIVNKWKENKK